MSARRNTTHRKTIARALAQQANIPYTRARRIVDLAGDANLLPATITDHATESAVRLLSSERVMALLLTAPTHDANPKAVAETAFRVRMTSLGFTDDDQDRLLTALAKPNAHILCAGMTFSGKTTTQYALMEYLRDLDLKVGSAEDPVERVIPGTHQFETSRNESLDETVHSMSADGQRWDVTNISEIRTVGAAQEFLFGSGIRIASIHSSYPRDVRHRFASMGIPDGGALFDECVDVVIEHHVLKSACHHLPRPQTLDAVQVERLKKIVPSVDVALPVPMHRQCPECAAAGTPKREFFRTVTMPKNDEGPSKAAAAAWELVTAGRMTVEQFLDAF